MQILRRFRRIVKRLVFPLPAGRGGFPAAGRRRSCDGAAEAPKTSCSSYYSATNNSHYDEAIEDCIEFFKSCQDGVLITTATTKSDDAVVIRFILLQNRQGKTRLAKYYLPFDESEKHKVEYEVYLILDEFILAGELQETSKKAIIERLGELEKQN